MFGLGKPRTKFGKFLDEYNLQQREIAATARVSEEEISKLCNPRYGVIPNNRTQVRLIEAIEKKTGKKVKRSDFW